MDNSMASSGHGPCNRPWTRSWHRPWWVFMVPSMDNAMDHPKWTMHFVARAMGGHGIFHGRSPWELPWIRLWFTMGYAMDGAIVQRNAMA